MKLGGEPTAKQKDAGSKMKKSAQAETEKRKSKDMFNSPIENSEDFFDENSEEYKHEQGSSNKNKKRTILIAIGAGVILLLILIIVILVLKPKNTTPPPPPVQQEQLQTEQQYNTSTEDKTQTSPKNNLGIQDFTGNTTMKSDKDLDDIDEDLEDLFGLSLRVDYTVSKIETITDFVNYEKKRGTWGGGLEIYYLDATYRDNKYIIQVPFKYYKELDDTGIVPVSMEVLRINSNTGTNDDERTVISYMKLDSKTLENIIKNK